MSCCELLLTIVDSPLSALTDKDCLSVTGYVYKSLWNRHSSVGANFLLEEVFTERVMAVRLAMASRMERQTNQLAQQITVTVASCSMSESHRQLLRDQLEKLQRSADGSATRAGEGDLRKHLSLFVNCLQALYSANYTIDIQVIVCF